MIGRRYSEESVQSDKKSWPFRVERGVNDGPSIIVQHEGMNKSLSPELISAMVLAKMTYYAEQVIGSSVKTAVVTVPAYFNNSQREATKAACKIAGIDEAHVLNEPTAAALAYGLFNKDLCRGRSCRRVLVFDLGGGTFDVSLLEMDKHGVVEVKATAGDTHLGGQDFDNRMVDHLIDDFQQRYNKDIRENKTCRGMLKVACEEAKRALSTLETTDICLSSFYQGNDFIIKGFTRARFEGLNKDLFEKCLQPLRRCLEDAEVNKDEVDEVILVGGSTRIPRVRTMLKDFFKAGSCIINHTIDPDLTVASGAAIQAASMLLDNTGVRGATERKGPGVILLDVTPLSLGLEVSNGLMQVVIPRNHRVPCRVVSQDKWSTASDGATSVRFSVYEGERPIARDNNKLGEFVMSGIRSAHRGEIKFQVVFRLDTNGILTVSAKNMESGNKDGLKITSDKLTLNEEQIDEAIRIARGLRSADNDRKKAMIERHETQEYVDRISSLLKDSGVGSNLKREVESVVKIVKDWLDNNVTAEFDEYEFQKDLLRKALTKLKDGMRKKWKFF